MKYKLVQGDNLETLKRMPDNSIDAVVTDPPYGLGKEQDMNKVLKDWLEKGYSEIKGKGFMGKEWDAYVPQPLFWKEVFRVLKPGGHILAFYGTRTYDIGVMAMRLAGFEIRDSIQWIYGSGFPKSHNIGKAIDKLQGNEREVVGYQHRGNSVNTDFMSGGNNITKGNSQYEGWGTALKPAQEPIVLARKPLSESSIAENVLKWGTGGINIDGTRIGNDTIMTNMKNTKGGLYNLGNEDRTNEVENTFNEGRFPANIIFECICDEVIKGEKGERSGAKDNYGVKEGGHWGQGRQIRGADYNDKGDIHTNPDCPCRLLDTQSKGTSRFFYQAKVSKKERNMGLDHFEDKIKTSLQVTMADGIIPESHNRFSSVVKNNHPTVKPISLMAYLCRLITPPGGTILDPFTGSGSTGIAALLEGFNFVGMELDADYMKIAEERIKNFESYREFIKK